MLILKVNYSFNTGYTREPEIRNSRSCYLPSKSLYDGDICRIYIFYDSTGKDVIKCCKILLEFVLN